MKLIYILFGFRCLDRVPRLYCRLHGKVTRIISLPQDEWLNYVFLFTVIEEDKRCSCKASTKKSMGYIRVYLNKGREIYSLQKYDENVHYNWGYLLFLATHTSVCLCIWTTAVHKHGPFTMRTRISFRYFMLLPLGFVNACVGIPTTVHGFGNCYWLCLCRESCSIIFYCFMKTVGLFGVRGWISGYDYLIVP